MKRPNLKRFAAILAIILMLIFVLLWLLSSAPVGIDKTKLDIINGVFGLLSIMVTLVPSTLDLFERVAKLGTTETKPPVELFSPVSLEQLRKRIDGENEIPPSWVDRGHTPTSILRRYRQILISGKPGSGKSREAWELIDRMVQENHVPSERILEPKTDFWKAEPNDLSNSLIPLLDHRLPCLFLIDGILSTNPPEAFQRIEILSEAVRQHPRGFMIITAQSSEFDQHLDWFSSHDIHHTPLLDLKLEQARQLVDRSAKQQGLTFLKGARSALLKKGDGTPRLFLLILQQAGKRGSQISTQDIQRALASEWSVLRGEIQTNVKDSRFLLEALDAFRLANLRPLQDEVLSYAAWLWLRSQRSNRREQPPDFWSILARLAAYHITEAEGLIHMDPLLAEASTPAEPALKKLNQYLQEQERLKNPRENYVERALAFLQRFGSTASLFGSILLSPAVLGFAILGALLAYEDQIAPETYLSIFWAGVILLGILGSLRGWARELLVSMGLILAFFLLTLLQDTPLSLRFLDDLDATKRFLLYCYILFFFSLFFARVASRLLTLNVQTRQDREDSLYGAMLGATNGYLLVGSVLYYLEMTHPLPALASLPMSYALYLPPQFLAAPGIYFAALLAIVFVVVVYI